MVDSVGATVYGYGHGLLLGEDGPWSNDTITYAYNTGRRRSSLVLALGASSAWTNSYAYDSAARLTNVTSPAGSFDSYYLASLNSTTVSSSLVAGRPYPGSSFITNSYDALARLLDTTLATNASVANVLNRYGYQYNAASQRIWIGRTNVSASTWNGVLTNTYNAAGELLTAHTYNSSGTAVTGEQFGYGYDQGWNMTNRTPGSSPTTYAANNLNEVTSDSTAGYSFTYDSNGNRTYAATSGPEIICTYDDDNQLITAASDTVYTPAGNRWQATFAYDGRMRLRVRKDYTWSSGWVLTTETHYIYDGMQILEERNGSNAPQVTYTRGWDFSGSLEGAGGIGGLLARSVHSGSSPYGVTSSAFYHADGNGNIVAMVDNAPSLKAYYKYDPFGRNLALGGTLSLANVMQFSSKLFVQPVYSPGMYYYGYRFYDQQTQRWLNRDPIEERGGINLYEYVFNNPADKSDGYGLDPVLPPGWHGPGTPYDPASNPFARPWDLFPCGNGIKEQVWDQYGANRPLNTDPSARLAHCIAHCRITRECAGGAATSWLGGFGKEVMDQFKKWGGGGGDGFDPGDMAANAKGRQCAKNKTRSCEDQCKEALNSGSLY
jgi:RHS repeat-associated protein